MTIQDDIERKKRELQELEGRQRSCAHQWGTIKYNPIGRKGYSAQPQWAKPYMTNVPSIWVPGTTTPRWTRQCSVCGMEQHTEKIKDHRRSGAVAGTTSVEQVPDFGDEERR